MLAPDPEAFVERIVVAVFQAFAGRWRRLPRNTLIATWLLRTTWLAVQRERRRLGLPIPPQASPGGVRTAFYRSLIRLPGRRLDALIRQRVLRVSVWENARGPDRNEERTAALAHRGLEQLGRALRRRAPGVDPRVLLDDMVRPTSDEFEQAVLEQLDAWSPRAPKSDLVRRIRRAWRCVAIVRTARRAGVTAAAALVLLLLAVAAAIWSARQGYLARWFIQHSGRSLAKEMPEVAQPARPWPARPQTAAGVSSRPPRTSAELYSLTSIWTAQLTFTPGQWKALAPSHVQPVPNLMGADGTIILRNPKARRNGLAGAVGLEFNWARAHLEFAGAEFCPVAARYRGNGTYLNSLFGAKRPFKVDLDKFAKGQHLAGIHTLNFVNAIPDNSYLHDALAQELFRDLGVPGPRTAYAYLTLDVPGRFVRQALGLYVLIENVDADFAADRFGSPDVPIFKPVTTELFEYLGDDWSAYADIYDLKTKATPQQLDRLIELARLVSQTDDAEFARRVAEYIDLDECAGFLAGHVLTSSYDGFLSNGQNFYMYLDPASGRIGLIPWDQDHGWGEFGYTGTADRRERASIWQPSTYRNRFLDRLLKVESFRNHYRRHLEHAVSGPFTPENLFPRIDQIGAIIRPAVAAESDFRLGRFDIAISTNWLAGPRDGPPEGPRAPVHQIKRFIVGRTQSVRDQLEGKTQGEILGRDRGG